VTVYARVTDLEDALQRVDDLGGSKVYGPNDVQPGLRAAAFRDPAGNIFGIYSQA
jgi:predicted enzyme related to lactoylglutathione lyase